MLHLIQKAVSLLYKGPEMKILIVEDAEYIRNHLIEQLSEIPGIEIVGGTGEYFESLRLVADSHPDLAILDIRIENGNGIDILAEITSNYPDIKTVMLTNYPFPQYRKRCMELGANYFLDKSRDFEKLPDIISGILNGEEKRLQETQCMVDENT